MRATSGECMVRTYMVIVVGLGTRVKPSAERPR
jgi:hypothetical protein